MLIGLNAAGPRAIRLRGALLAISLLMNCAASAQPVLTFDRALHIAQERSRQLTAQDYAAQAAREMAIAAAQLPDPTLTAGVNNLPVTGPDRFSLTRDFMTMRSVSVMQQFTRGEKRTARAARYDREAEAATAGREVALAELQRDTALAWLDRYYQERVLQLLITQRDEARLQVQAADAAYRGGRSAQTDVFLARSGVAQIEDRISQTEQQIQVATTRLARWIGSEASAPLGAAPSTGEVDFTIDRLQDHIDHHPQLELLLRQEQVVRAEVEIAQANKRSDWTAELMYSQRGPDYSNMVSINFSIPWQLDQKNRQDRELASKLAQIDQLQAQREEMTREHLADALSWLQQWRGYRDRLNRYEDSLIPLATERTRAALAAYRSNSASLSTVLEARRMEIDTRLEQVRLQMEYAGVWAKLEFLLPLVSTHRGERK